MKEIEFNNSDKQIANLFEKVIEECLVKYTKIEYKYSVKYTIDSDDDFNKVVAKLKSKTIHK